MAAENAPAFDDLSPVEEPEAESDDEVPTIKLEPGEILQGTLLSIEEKGQYGDNVLRIKSGNRGVVEYWDCKGIRRQFTAADVSPGDYVGIRKSEEMESFETENDEGEAETVEYFTFEVRVR
jgi:hypothetical protein